MGLSHTVSGDIAHFRTPSRVPIESLKFHFLPKQEGSGDPSPSNVRPITGWTGLTGHYANDNIIGLSDLQFMDNSSNVDLLVTGDTIKITAKKNGNTWAISSQDATLAIPETLRGKSVYFGVEDVILESVNKSDQRSSIVCEFRDKNNAFIIDPTVVYVKIGANDNTYFRTYTIPSNAVTMKLYFRIAQNISAYGVSIGDYIIYKNFYIRYPSNEHKYTKHEGGSIPVTFPVAGINKLDPNSIDIYTRFELVNGIYKNTDVDTRQTIQLSVQLWKTRGTYIKTAKVDYSTEIGRHSITFNIDEPECNFIVLKHNGMKKDFILIFPRTLGFGTFTISCDVLANDPTTVGGVQISNIQLESGNTSHSYEPYSSDNTFYGGYIDPVAGEIVAEYKKHIYDGTTMKVVMNFKTSDKFYGINRVSDCQYGNSGRVISNMLKTQYNHGGNVCYQRPSDPGYLMDFERSTICDLSLEEYDALTISEQTDLVNSYLAELYENGTPLIVIYKLIDPIHIPISAEDMKAYLDHNNFWSDANDITEVTYAVTESKDILEARKRAFATDNYNHGTLVFELNGDDAPVDGAWIERKSNKAFILNSAASYDSVNKIYDFSGKGAAYYRFYNDDKPVIYLGHHFRIEWDVYFKRNGTTNGHFFDIGSLTNATKALGIGLLSKNANAITFNWKLQGNSSNPFVSSGETRSHPNAPISGDTNYTHFTGFHEIINGGDGYDRLRIKIGDRIVKYETQIPQVEYGPLWQSSNRFIAVGAGVYNASKEVSEYDTDYLCDVKIRSIKIYMLD